MLSKIWNSIFVTTYHQIEAEKTSNSNLDKKVMIILFIVAFSLLFNEYLGEFGFLISSPKILSLHTYFPNFELNYLKFEYFLFSIQRMIAIGSTL